MNKNIKKIGFGVRQMHMDKAFHGISTAGGGLGTKMGIYVNESEGGVLNLGLKTAVQPMFGSWRDCFLTQKHG